MSSSAVDINRQKNEILINILIITESILQSIELHSYCKENQIYNIKY